MKYWHIEATPHQGWDHVQAKHTQSLFIFLLTPGWLQRYHRRARSSQRMRFIGCRASYPLRESRTHPHSHEFDSRYLARMCGRISYQNLHMLNLQNSFQSHHQHLSTWTHIKERRVNETKRIEPQATWSWLDCSHRYILRNSWHQHKKWYHAQFVAVYSICRIPPLQRQASPGATPAPILCTLVRHVAALQKEIF